MAQTYYEILGVAQNATAEEIEAAFKKRAREVHPDTVAPGNAYLRQVAAEAFKDLSQAKATLLNPFEREKYDAKLIYERAPSSGAPPTRQASPRRRRDLRQIPTVREHQNRGLQINVHKVKEPKRRRGAQRRDASAHHL